MKSIDVQLLDRGSRSNVEFLLFDPFFRRPEQLSNVPTLFLKTDSTTYLDAQSLKTKIQALLTVPADAWFLGQWGGNCQHHTRIMDRTAPSNVIWIDRPNGWQGVILSVGLMTQLLKKNEDIDALLAQPDLKLAAYHPDLLVYDVTQATTEADYAKLNSCQLMIENFTSEANVLAPILLIIIIFCFLVIGHMAMERIK